MTGGGINVRNSGRNELQPADTWLLVFSPPTLLFNLDWNKKKLELLPCWYFESRVSKVLYGSIDIKLLWEVTYALKCAKMLCKKLVCRKFERHRNSQFHTTHTHSQFSIHIPLNQIKHMIFLYIYTTQSPVSSLFFIKQWNSPFLQSSPWPSASQHAKRLLRGTSS